MRDILAKRTDSQTLRRQIEKRWPEAIQKVGNFGQVLFKADWSEFDALFSMGGIPCGQIIEITGSKGSGKTGFLMRLLSGFLRHPARSNLQAAYIDFSNCFFPTAAEWSGIDASRLFVVKPCGIKSGLRSAELLLKHGQATIIVCDLVGIETMLPVTILHRLRQKIIRARGLVIFLTDNSSEIVPASMASLRLEISRAVMPNSLTKNRTDSFSDSSTLVVTVTKSRISLPGKRLEVCLDK